MVPKVGWIVLALVLAVVDVPAAGIGAPADSIARPPAPPNVIVILIDDLGYGDLGIYGNDRVETPNIDRLAREGTRFTQFYANAPICSPSRVALLTGTYPQRWGISSFIASRERNARRGLPDYLDPDAPSIARAFKDAGYVTAHFGKWHMGGGRDVDDAPLPDAYGFDESRVSFEGLGDRYLWPMGLARQSAELGRGRVEWTEKHEMTRIYVDHALNFVRKHRDQPFYLNLWPNDVHDPFVPSPRPGLMEKYAEIARNEYEQRFFAVLDEMDRQLGRFFDGLAETGLDRQTIVVVTSDNGATDWPRYYDEGVVPPGSSGPFRGRKWSLYEGGVRMPLIVWSPGLVPQGRVDDETLMAAIDLFPTLADLSRVPAPPSLDGEVLVQALLGHSVVRKEPIFWHYPNDLKPGNSEFVTPQLAVRDGRWKLLAAPDGGDVELYDLNADPGEKRDLAESRPAIRERLLEQLLAWWRSVNNSAHINGFGSGGGVPLLDVEWDEESAEIGARVHADKRDKGFALSVDLPNASPSDRIEVGRLPDAPFSIDMTFEGEEGPYHLYCVPLTEPVHPMLRRSQPYLMNFRPGANAEIGEEGHVMCQERSMRGILPDSIETRWHVRGDGGLRFAAFVPWETLRLKGAPSGLGFSLTIHQQKHEDLAWRPGMLNFDADLAAAPKIPSTVVRQPALLKAAYPAHDEVVFVLEDSTGRERARSRGMPGSGVVVAEIETEGLPDGTYTLRVDGADSPSIGLVLAGAEAASLAERRRALGERAAELAPRLDAAQSGHLQRAELMLTLSELPRRARPDDLVEAEKLLDDTRRILEALSDGRPAPGGTYDHPAGFSADGQRGPVRFEPVADQAASVTVSMRDEPGWSVQPFVYGTFSEPVVFDRPIYTMLYAQQLRNPSFEWGHPDAKSTVERFVAARELEAKSASDALGGAWFVRAAAEIDELAAPWIGIGGGQVRFEMVGDAPNTEKAQRIISDSDAAGVAQIISLPTWRTGIFTLRGFARSDGGAENVRAVVYHDGMVVAEAPIEQVGGKWQAFEAALVAPTKSGAENTYAVAIVFEGPGSLDLDLVTLYPDDALGGFDPQAVEQIRGLQTGWMRWPGGNYASAYRWRDGVGPRKSRRSTPNPAWRGLHSNFVGTDEFIELTERTGTEPLICVNAGDGTPEEAAAWVEYVNGDTTTAMGRLRAANAQIDPYGVRYWNIGNELWGFWQVGHCDPDENARRYKAFADAMLEVDPSIRLIACGVGAHSIGDPVTWNEPLLEDVGSQLDIIDVHSYVNVPEWADLDDRRRAMLLSAIPVSYETWLMSFREDLLERGLGHVKVDVGEYNGNANTESDEAEERARLLYYAAFLHAFIRQSEYVMGANATEFSAFDPRALPFSRMHPRYELHRLYASEAGSEPLRAHVETPVVHQARRLGRDVVPIFNLPLIDAVALRDSTDGSISVSIINRSEERMPVEISLEDAGAQAAEWLLFDGKRVTRSALAATDESAVSLPPLSVSLIRFRISDRPR